CGKDSAGSWCSALIFLRTNEGDIMDTISPKIDIFERDVTREHVEDAIITLLVWVGENPAREGLSVTAR
ncbi:hypothetical protein AB9F39_37565, partial [Rhizobium leguminosarum]